MSTGRFLRCAVLGAAVAAVATGAWAEDFPAPVEAWRSRIEAKAEDTGIPIEFLLKWVQVESGGNPCSLGIPNREAGIAQTYHPDDDRYGATFDELRAACVPGKQTLARPLTDDEKDRQVDSLVNLVKGSRDAVRGQLKRAGATWSESSPDFWNLVKLRHALPAWGGSFLSASTKKLGHPPASWAEWREWVEGLSDKEVIAIDSGVKPWASLAQRRKLFDNAEKTGSVVEEAQADPGDTSAEPEAEAETDE